jgi:oligoendopeptidase F
MERRRQNPEAFAPLYEDLLSAGGAKTYVEALQPFGMNPRQKSFWAEGCTRLEHLVDEFEALDLKPPTTARVGAKATKGRGKALD